MYKIKYGKKKLKALMKGFLFLLLFAAGGGTAVFMGKDRMEKAEDRAVSAEERALVLARELSEIKAPDSSVREVWVDFVDRSSYISEGDRIDIRMVYDDGDDEKLLSGKIITRVDNDGMQLLVDEDELALITGAKLKMEGSSGIRAYAVRIP